MWITNGEKYVNLDNAGEISIDKDSQGSVRLLVDGKPAFDLDVSFGKASSEFHRLMTGGAGPYSKRVLHLVDCGLMTQPEVLPATLEERWGRRASRAED